MSKPLKHACPEKYCFMWHYDIAQCGEAYKAFDSGNECIRKACDNPNAIDWYEPCEPELDEVGLPYDYFDCEEYRVVNFRATLLGRWHTTPILSAHNNQWFVINADGTCQFGQNLADKLLRKNLYWSISGDKMIMYAAHAKDSPFLLLSGLRVTDDGEWNIDSNRYGTFCKYAQNDISISEEYDSCKDEDVKESAQ